MGKRVSVEQQQRRTTASMPEPLVFMSKCENPGKKAATASEPQVFALFL